MAKIKQEIIDLIKNDYSFQGAIIAVANKHPRTIENWLDSNSDMLTTHSVLNVIKERTGKNEDELFETQNVNA